MKSLKAFVDDNGGRIPQQRASDPAESSLANFLTLQIQYYNGTKGNSLTKEKVAIWNRELKDYPALDIRGQWWFSFWRVQQLVSEYGSVGMINVYDDPVEYGWLDRQRSNKRGKAQKGVYKPLSTEQLELLQDLEGFVWGNSELFGRGTGLTRNERRNLGNALRRAERVKAEAALARDAMIAVLGGKTGGKFLYSLSFHLQYVFAIGF